MADRKIVFLDIDGTFTVPLEKPTVLASRAVREARKNGHKVLLSTGRNMPIVSADVLEVGFDGVVASAGRHIEIGGKVIRDSVLPEETIQNCLQVFHKFGIYCRIESPEGIYIDNRLQEILMSAAAELSNSELVRMKKELASDAGVKPYTEYPRKGAYKLGFICTGLDELEKTKPYLEQEFHYVVHPYAEGADCYNGEIIRRDMDKGEAMERVCAYYGADLADTVAFGDSMNDLQMLQCAGLAVAMGNSCQELKDSADVVCESVDEDGVYYEFKRQHLI
ncbi:MAG: Cof-type HAD-IIB family hydrolase [Eubacterium sp.]|nr:Cof-type HAD-IIB family hydrolase [Eubacterium sp.]